MKDEKGEFDKFTTKKSALEDLMLNPGSYSQNDFDLELAAQFKPQNTGWWSNEWFNSFEKDNQVE